MPLTPEQIKALNNMNVAAQRVKLGNLLATGGGGGGGFSPSAKVEQEDDGALITITDIDGTTTAKVTNGKDGSNKAYERVIDVENTDWTVTHGLDYKYPDVFCLDQDGNIIVGDITYVNNNKLTIHFSQAVSGRAIVTAPVITNP